MSVPEILNLLVHSLLDLLDATGPEGTQEEILQAREKAHRALAMFRGERP